MDYANWLIRLFSEAHPLVQAMVLVMLLVLSGWGLWQYFKKRHKISEFHVERNDLRNQVRDRDLRVRELETQFESCLSRENSLKNQVDTLNTEKGKLSQQLEDGKKKDENTKKEMERVNGELKALEKRFKDLQIIDTDVWLGQPREGSSPVRFFPRNERATRFVAFLNLKGGVGKTTLVANLGAAYATGITGSTYRVLVVDLDYQGTLSNMCVDDKWLKDRRSNKNTSRVLLEDEIWAERKIDQVLLSLMVSVDGTNELAKAIVASEDLDHMDFRQQARFAVNQHEVRFHHRRIFHDPWLLSRFDFVFFDCPPRLTTSAINCLTAADFVLVPTGLHPNDVDAVPRTLQWLEKLRNLNSFQARLAGLVLNKTYRSGTVENLTNEEKRQLERLQFSIQRYEPGGSAVLKNLVEDKAQVARFAAGSVPLGTHREGHQIYGGIANEIFERIKI